MKYDLKTNINKYGISTYYGNNTGISLAEASFIPLLAPIPTKKSKLYFNRINVIPLMRGKGIGSLLLKELLKNVKRLDSALKCDINPYGELGYNELKEWYKRHGFKEYLSEGEYELWYNL